LENEQQQREVKENECTIVATSAPASRGTTITTHIGSLNAVPVSMLSPTLAKDTFQRQQTHHTSLHHQEQHRPLSFQGSGQLVAELVIGRLALCGIFCTTIVSLFTDQSLPQQIRAYPDNILLVTLAVLSASLVVVKDKTTMEKKKVNREENGMQLHYVPVLSNIEVEKWVGRVAMLCFASLLAWQLLFPWKNF
jgi:hypothetical protein